MVMPGRKFSAENGYRFGFNGKENDNEVKGDGNQQDYGLRIYDTRIGKFLSTDPLGKKFPFLTPYQYASNSPIAFVDLDGAESNYASFKMMAESIEAEAALYKGNTKSMPFRLQSQLFMLGMAKSASVEGLMYEVDKSLQGTFSNLPSINFNELPPTIQQTLMEDAIDRNSPFGITAIVKGLGTTISEAVNGNPEALGNIAGMVLAARMFKMAESDLAKLESGKYLQNAKNVVGSAEEATKLIGEGIADFKTLENVTTTSLPKTLTEGGVVDKLTGKTPSDVRSDLVNAGWSENFPQASTPNKIQHTVYTKVSKSGKIYTIDYHPGGGVHSNAYWKVYFQENANAPKTVLGRISTEGFTKYDKITDSPVYIDGKKSN